MKFKRAFLAEPGRMEILEINEEPGDEQVMIKVASCGLCNWELNHWKGFITTGGYPMPLGHEYAGTVVKVGKNVKKFKVGDKVSSLSGRGGFAEYMCCKEATTVRLPDDIDPKYVLGEPVKCIVTVLDAIAPRIGDYGIIIGCGPMGQWCIQGLAGNLLAGLIAVDINDAKLEMAKKYGATHTINSKKENVVERLTEITSGHLADFVVEGTGVHALLNQALDYLKPTGQGRLIVMSAYESMSPDFDFRKCVAKSVDIHVAHPGHTQNPMDDMRRACEMIAKGTFNIKELISHEYKLSEIQTAMENLEHKPMSYMKGLVYPD